MQPSSRLLIEQRRRLFGRANSKLCIVKNSYAPLLCGEEWGRFEGELWRRVVWLRQQWRRPCDEGLKSIKVGSNGQRSATGTVSERLQPPPPPAGVLRPGRRRAECARIIIASRLSAREAITKARNKGSCGQGPARVHACRGFPTTVPSSRHLQ